MLRTAITPLARPITSRRGLVSAVLLSTKSYESKSLRELRDEARTRGLTQSGAKTALISRLQEDDQRAQQPVRNVATTAPVAAAVPQQPPAPPSNVDFMNIRLPRTDYEPPEPPVQVPFVPDFWDSSAKKEAETVKVAPVEVTPKIVVVASESTHRDGGPNFNVYQHPVHSEPSTSTATAPQQGIIRDILDDLMIPKKFTIGRPSRDAEAAFVASLPDDTTTSTHLGTPQTRKLNADERKGVWIIFGIFAGSFALSSIINP